MGVNAPSAARLARAKQEGAVFTDTVTVGRMGLAVPEVELAAIARTLDLDPAIAPDLARDKFADRFFRLVLGAQSVQSIDYSPYQHASIMHDMNVPVPEELHECCDALYDGGAMEHIFDVKQVMANYMAMVRPGGRIFINVPANNLFGHGFYQFSSEFFYRVFDASNGFVVRDMLAIEAPFTSVETGQGWRCFKTPDPAVVGTRIRLVSDKPLMLFVSAERTERVTPFAQLPVQSDYKVRWNRADETGKAAPPPTDSGTDERMDRPFSYLTAWQALKQQIKQWRKHSLRNRRFFERIDPL